MQKTYLFSVCWCDFFFLLILPELNKGRPAVPSSLRDHMILTDTCPKGCQSNWKIVSERDVPLTITCYYLSHVRFLPAGWNIGVLSFHWMHYNCLRVCFSKNGWVTPCVHLMGHVNSTPDWLWSGHWNKTCWSTEHKEIKNCELKNQYFS